MNFVSMGERRSSMVAGGTLLFILGYVTLFDRIRYDLLDDEGNEEAKDDEYTIICK